ncbi:MAG TPA: VTT domain-containing protein [Noviherbaspirillum sp.]
MDGRRRRTIGRAILFLLLFAALAFWLLFASPVAALRRVQEWIDSFGFWGPAVFLLFYILAVVVLVPGSMLALLAGLAYGMWGLPLALAAATTGASISFLIARHLLRSQVQAIIQRRLLWRAFERAVSEGGWRIVALVRLSPVLPFNLQNYFFGITSIRFRHYLPATLLGIVPGTTVNVSLATAGYAMSMDGMADLWHPLKLLLFALGLAVTVIVCWTITRRVRAILQIAGQAAGES